MFKRFQLAAIAVLLSGGVFVARADSPPVVTAAVLGCEDAFQLDVTFDEPVDLTGALDPFNYVVFQNASNGAPGLLGDSVTAIPGRLNSFRVILEHGAFVPDARAMLRVEYVMDLAGNLVDRRLIAVTPCLRIEQIGLGGIQITWSANSTEFGLESTTSLSASDWQPVTDSVAQEGERFVVRLEALGTQRFYRLRKP